MASLPRVLGLDDLPLAERMAARLDGELYALAGVHCPVDEVETPALRLAAVLAGRSDRYIAELGTAAWVWGAAAIPPERLELCVDLRARARPTQARHASVREVVVDDGEVRVLEGGRVTSPLRTAVDLARAREPFTEGDAQLVRQLAVLGGFGVPQCLALMDLRRNLPGKRRAAERLMGALC
jgi:hypothetical protein